VFRTDKVIPFSKILGQDRAVRFLREAMAKGKMPHAYLFVGIHGVGKTTTALALCQALNCEHPGKGDGCGQCSSCKKMMSGNFPDLIIVEPENQVIKIEQIRALDRVFSFKPVAGNYRLTVIRQAETMTEEAANAFLKTLEEPPPGNILVLNVVEPLDLLPTILSRCQRVSFRPIPAVLIEVWLVENQGIEKEKASVVARMATGSPGKALEMGKGDFLEKRQDLLFNLTRIMSLAPEEVVEWAMAYSGKEKKEKKETAFSLLLGVWKTWYRDLLLTKAGCSDEALINMDFSRELKNASADFNIENLQQSFFILDQAERDLAQSRNLDLLIETAVLKLKRLYGRARKASEQQRPARGFDQGRGRPTAQIRQSPEF
jgi:DNA polymerase III subunit delta'